MKSNSQNWFVYIVRCRDSSLYTGISNDVEKRIKKHNLGTAAAYTRGRGPVSLVYTEEFCDRSNASKRETAIKKLNKNAKESLIKKNNN